MKIIFATNYSYPQVGGSENVIKEVSERFALNPENSVFVLSNNVKAEFCEKAVSYLPLKSYEAFVSFVNQSNIDILMVYSDCFIYWKDIILNPERLKCKIVLCPVGFNATEKNTKLYTLLSSNGSKIFFIPHSKNYKDYSIVEYLKLNNRVIPNGIDLKCFTDNSIDFKKKYSIEDKKVILNVSNFFPGKGQEFASELIPEEIKKDCVFVSISSKINLPFESSYLSKCIASFNNKKIKNMFLRSVGREIVLSAFKCSDIFLFTSQKEVSPLVVIECIAAKLPWVSMPVGNCSELPGGIIIPNQDKDFSGNYVFNQKVKKEFKDTVYSILTDDKRKKDITKNNLEFIEKRDWDKIQKEYENYFKEII